jgi:hypothetical protein
MVLPVHLQVRYRELRWGPGSGPSICELQVLDADLVYFYGGWFKYPKAVGRIAPGRKVPITL